MLRVSELATVLCGIPITYFCSYPDVIFSNSSVFIPLLLIILNLGCLLYTLPMKLLLPLPSTCLKLANVLFMLWLLAVLNWDLS